MLEAAALAKLLVWTGVAAKAADLLSILWPKSWTNVEVRFLVEKIGLGFSCDDKSMGLLRVRVLDSNLDDIAYMEGVNGEGT